MILYLAAINKLLPEIETFLREALATESLTEPTNQRREQLLSRLEGLAKPPQLPPRGGGGVKRISASYIGDEFINKPPTVTALADLHSTRDFISKQREISWRQKESDVPSASQVVPAPYASKKRNQMSESEQVNLSFIHCFSANKTFSNICIFQIPVSKEVLLQREKVICRGACEETRKYTQHTQTLSSLLVSVG